MTKTAREVELEFEIESLKRIVKSRENPAGSSKTFLYMVIHDLKHPIESI